MGQNPGRKGPRARLLAMFYAGLARGFEDTYLHEE
jgi:hypothetical protein